MFKCPGNGIKNFGDVYCRYSFKNFNSPVVVTFSSKGGYISTEESKKEMPIWGFEYLKNKEINVISFSCINGDNWYTDPTFHKSLQAIGNYLEKFDEVLGYGGSMGAFAVSTFSNILNIKRNLLINPISSLLPCITPFETRFRNDFKKNNWNHPYIDGAMNHSKGIIIYDPLYQKDSLHAKRYSDNYRKLKLPGVGHNMPRHLLNLKMLDWLFNGFYNKNLSEIEFYKKARSRRDYIEYFNFMLSDKNKRLSKKRTKIIETHFNIWKIKKGIGYVINEGDIDNIRDVALEVSSTNIPLSIKLLELALAARPNGTLIKKRLNELKTKKI